MVTRSDLYSASRSLLQHQALLQGTTFLFNAMAAPVQASHLAIGAFGAIWEISRRALDLIGKSTEAQWSEQKEKCLTQCRKAVEFERECGNIKSQLTNFQETLSLKRPAAVLKSTIRAMPCVAGKGSLKEALNGLNICSAVCSETSFQEKAWNVLKVAVPLLLATAAVAWIMGENPWFDLKEEPKESLSSRIVPISNLESLKKLAEKTDKIVIVDFYATWCPPCRKLERPMNEWAEKLKDKVIFCKVNVDESPEIAQHYQIHRMPTFITLDRKGNEIESKRKAGVPLIAGSVQELFKQFKISNDEPAVKAAAS